MLRVVRHLFLIWFMAQYVTSWEGPPRAATVGSKKNVENPARHLTAVRTIEVPSEFAAVFMRPLRCDEDGNLYVNTDQFGVSAIRKLGPNGKRLALFQPSSEPDHLKVAAGVYFSIDSGGDVYQLVFLADQIDRYVFVYKPDGALKSKIKLDPGFPWVPAAVAPFSSGGFLITGQQYDRDPAKSMWPVTGIFSDDGRLLKEISLEDDGSIRDMTEAGDRRVVSPQNPTSNRAISFSQMQSAADGNVYLMRWLSLAFFYAISAGGEVVRRFAVDPGDPEYRVAAMHISGSRIAILFVQPQSRKNLIKVTDLLGHEIATYEEPNVDEMPPPQTRLGATFACYIHQPEQFIFLESGSEDKLQIVIAEPK